MISEETRKKMSEAHKGEKNHNFRKPLSEENRKLISERMKKRWEDPECRKMMCRSMQEHRAGCIVSEETRRKISEANKGKHYPSKESRQKMSESHRKRHGTDPNSITHGTSACIMLKLHHEALKNDPERLSTDFLQKLIGVDCN